MSYACSFLTTFTNSEISLLYSNNLNLNKEESKLNTENVLRNVSYCKLNWLIAHFVTLPQYSQTKLIIVLRLLIEKKK